MSLDGRFFQVNPALCLIVAYEEHELLQTTLPAITHPEDIESDDELVRRMLANDIPSYQIEKRYPAPGPRGHLGPPDGFVGPRYGWSPALLRHPVPEHHSLQGDRSQATRGGSALPPPGGANSGGRTRRCRGASGYDTYVSPRIEALLGYSPEEWLTTPDMWLQLVHPDDCDRVQATLDNALATKQPFQLECRLLARDGQYVWIENQAALMRDEMGVDQYWQGFMVDITERKRAEAELRAAKEAAEEASRVKRVLLSMASHELRTPLTIITGYVELLASSADSLGSEEREFLEVIQTSTASLTTLVNDLLDLARIEAQRLKFATHPVDVGELVGEGAPHGRRPGGRQGHRNDDRADAGCPPGGRGP